VNERVVGLGADPAHDGAGRGSRHVVKRAAEARFEAGPGDGFARWAMVGEDMPAAVHTGFGTCALEPGGSVPPHLHSYEEAFYVLDGPLVLRTAEGSHLLRAGDYGVLPVGVVHGWDAPGDTAARWADMLAPQPRARRSGDTYPARLAVDDRPPVPVDARDPRTRYLGHIEPANMDPDKQTQDMLAVSASMRTALLVYSGITVKMMVDTDLGASLTTMFMVQYGMVGNVSGHDHPFEETYLFLDGEGEAVFDGERYLLGPGDVAFAGVGCVHGFRNVGSGPLRWLETQAPQPPSRHSYRYDRDWTYLEGVNDA
jgi:quercetin dioxygenase-like cupin family protein